MPGPQDFINPIVQAMMGLHEGTMQRNQQALDKRKQTENERAAQVQEQQKREEQRQANDLAERQYALAKAGLDWQKELEAQHRHVEGIKLIQGQLDKGATLPDQEVGAPSIGTPTIGPGGMPLILPQAGATDRTGVPMGQTPNPLDPGSNLSRAIFAGPGQQIQHAANFAGATAGATAEAQDKFKQAEAANKAVEEGKQRLLLGEQNKAADAKKDAADNELKRQMAQDRKDTLIALAGFKHQVDPTAVKANLNAYATGEGNFDANTPANTAVREAAEANGYRSFPTKDRQTLQAMQSLNTVFPQLEKFVEKYLPDEEASGSTQAKIKAYVKGKIVGTELPSDAKNALNAIKTNAVNYAKVIEGQSGSRISNQQMSLALDGMTSGKITKQQGRDLIQNLRDQYVNKEQNIILGGMGDEQKALISKKWGYKLAEGGTPAADAPKYKDVRTNPKTGHQIGTNDGQNWFDVQTGNKI